MAAMAVTCGRRVHSTAACKARGKVFRPSCARSILGNERGRMDCGGGVRGVRRYDDVVRKALAGGATNKGSMKSEAGRGIHLSPTMALQLAGKGRSVVRLYRRTELSAAQDWAFSKLVKGKYPRAGVTRTVSEQCYNVEIDEPLTGEEAAKLVWLLSETFEVELLQSESSFDSDLQLLEVGPRLSFSTAWCTNALSICRACGLAKVRRLERSRRFGIASSVRLEAWELDNLAAMLHDRMTEMIYKEPLKSFAVSALPQRPRVIPLLERGMEALVEINAEMGLAFDEWDLNYYAQMFRDDLKRNPTDVELFDIAQSNSEHSRHWFFKAKLSVDGEEIDECLFDIVRDTLRNNPGNSVIGYHDNSSAIRGSEAMLLVPLTPGQPSPVLPKKKDMDLLFTAETHNFPCAVAPYPGAETGAGGRIRDTHATGRGSVVVASTSGYCVGNLRIPSAPHDAELGEAADFEYPTTLASPLQILIDASNGASDYGNKFGEPMIAGYTRTFGLRLPDGTRREWLKPIMFSAGIGQIAHDHLEKMEGDIGVLIVKIGGPAYRIGLGGGAASSLASGSQDADLDFNAVQRGDAEMAQKLNRVVRGCIELGEKNPILSIHDQGAGGNCNVVKEISYPKGAEIDIRAIHVGDETLSVLEIWGAEYQENDCLLIKPENVGYLRSLCERERLLMSVLGSIDGSGRIVLVDKNDPEAGPAEDLDLELVLGDMPRKKFSLKRQRINFLPVKLPSGPEGSVMIALEKVLRLPAVGSKRFLTTKVDRSVTGLVAQQQCVGPLLLPLADYAAISQGYYGVTGGITSIGEQPIKGILDPSAMARLAAAEAVTNMMFARTTGLSDVKASGNWMYAAKMGGEGGAMYDAALSLRDVLIELGMGIDGGKDSLSMAAQAGGETVMSPGNLVISAYVTSPDIAGGLTPDLKLGDGGRLLYIDFGRGKRRLGGSALAQAYGQVGNESPDLEDPSCLKRAFEVTQTLLEKRMIASGHDISDGGLVTSLLEMCFAGNSGISVNLPTAGGATGSTEDRVIASLFAEEPGVFLEVSTENEMEVMKAYRDARVSIQSIGKVVSDPVIKIAVDNVDVIDADTAVLRSIWDETAFELEQLQCALECVEQEQKGMLTRSQPCWNVPYEILPPSKVDSAYRHRVAVIREEGSNGDREMSAVLEMAGLEPWDVTMTDLIDGKITLDGFRAVAFVGGFSYADTLDSAKGWAGTIRLNAALWDQFCEFRSREDTVSLGVCNGCQLMALLGWIPSSNNNNNNSGSKVRGEAEIPDQPRFVHNASGRFESRFVQVLIQANSPAVMLKGMEEAVLGVWCSHGEGQAKFPNRAIFDKVMSQRLAPLRYVDESGKPSETYPFNPNGSPEGIAALCSADGRHLAMMPHPERSFLSWQLPYVPPSLGLDNRGPSPWLKMFQNMREWLDSN